MKTYVIFSSREPLLIATRRPIRDGEVIDHLRRIGCTKFISREVPADNVRRQYGIRFDAIERALEQGSDLRVLDYSGERVFQSIPLSDYGPAYGCDSSPVSPRTDASPPPRVLSR